MTDLKLIALDTEDLAVLSAHLQDAVIRGSDMVYLKGERRFAAVGNRFDWSESVASRAVNRKRCGIRFERVLGAQVTGFRPGDADTVLALLSMSFEETSPPSGTLTLTFSGNAAIRLDVECIEAEMQDLGAAWETGSRPDHDADGAA